MGGAGSSDLLIGRMANHSEGHARDSDLWRERVHDAPSICAALKKQIKTMLPAVHETAIPFLLRDGTATFAMARDDDRENGFRRRTPFEI